MIVKESILKFENFSILNTICHYNHSEDLTREQLYSYPVDIDFDILGHKEEQIFKIVVSAKINSENKPGYTISVLSATLPLFSTISVLVPKGVSVAFASIRKNSGISDEVPTFIPVR